MSKVIFTYLIFIIMSSILAYINILKKSQTKYVKTKETVVIVK